MSRVNPPQHETASSIEHAEPTVRRLRYTPTALLPLIIAAICALPFASGLGAWGLLLVIPFVLGVIWLRRVGMDIRPDDVRVRGALSSVTIPRSELVGFTVDKKHVHLARKDGSTVRIPTVRPRDLPALRNALFPDARARAAESTT